MWRETLDLLQLSLTATADIEISLAAIFRSNSSFSGLLQNVQCVKYGLGVAVGRNVFYRRFSLSGIPLSWGFL
jgi:hypothetical protein